MISVEESAGLLLQTIRPHIIIPDHTAESDILMAIRNHIDTDRHHLVTAVSHNESIIDDEQPHKPATW